MKKEFYGNRASILWASIFKYYIKKCGYIDVAGREADEAVNEFKKRVKSGYFSVDIDDDK